MTDNWGLFNPPGVSPFDETEKSDDDFNPDWLEDLFGEDDDE